MADPLSILQRLAPPVWTASAVVWLVVLGQSLAGCGRDDRSFDAPDLPAHDDSEEGYMHARGKDTPFLCGDGGGGRTECPDDLWPETRDLSCDASGCHGSHEYTPDAVADARDLLGSDGPSCYSCHGREWSERTR